MIISLINQVDSPIQDDTKFHAFAIGGAPSPSVKTHDGDTALYENDDMRPNDIPMYYVDAVAGEPSGPLKKYTGAQYNALAVVKDEKDEIKMRKAMGHQKEIEALKAMKSDSTYTAVSNTKIDKYIAKIKARRDS